MKSVTRRTSSLGKLLPALSAAIIASALSAHAANQTWTGGSTIDGNWSDTANWGGNPAPGDTASTTNTDTATFSGSIANTWGTAAHPIVIDSTTQNIGSIAFSGNGASAALDSYTVGTTAGNSLFLSSGGAISVNFASGTGEGNFTYTDAVNAPLVLEGSYTFSNSAATAGSSTTSAGILDIGGSVTGASGLGAITLNLNGTNTLGNTVSGVVGNGTSNTLSVSKGGTGAWTLSGTNTYTGGTSITAGILTGANASAFGTGTVTLGDSTGTFNTTLAISPATTGITVANAINVQGGNTGTATITTALAGQTEVLTGTITLGTASGAGHNLAITTSNVSGPKLTISGVIQDPSGLVGAAGSVAIGSGASSSSVITLSGNNTYTGGTSLTTAGLFLGNTNALGTGTLTVNSGGLGVSGAGSLTVGNALILNGNLTGENSAGSLTVNGGVALTGSRVVAESNGTINFGGVIADSGGSNFALTINGSSTVASSSVGLNAANTYDGGTTLEATGLGLRLNIGNLGSSSSASALGTGTFTIGASGNVTSLSINNTSGAAGTLATNNAEVWNADFSFSGTNNLNMGTGAVSLGTLAGATRTVTVSSHTFEVDGVISNGTNGTTPTINLTKAGTGTLVLGGANAYTGSTTIAASGGVLQIGNGGTSGSLAAGSGINGISLASGTSLAFNRTDNGLNISQVISGAGNVSQIGTGTTTLSGTNTYTGITSITAGDLSVSAIGNGGSTSGNLGSATNVAANILINGGTLSYTGAGESTDRLFTINGGAATATATLDASGTGAINFSNTGNVAYGTTNQTRTLNLTGSNTGSNTLSALIANNGTGAVTLNKTGAGTWVLSNANTYTGATTISGGNLAVTGTLASGSTVSVGGQSGGSATAMLSGNGTIGGAIITSSANSNVAYVAPGTVGTVGTLHVGTLGFTIGAGTQFDYDINNGNSQTAGGTSNDLITMGAGTLSIGGSGVVFNFSDLGGALSTTGSYTLISGATSVSGFSAGDFSAAGIGSDTAVFSTSGGNLYVAFSAGVSSPNYYFTGSTSNTFTDPTNFFTAASGGSPQSLALSSTSNVYLDATSPTPANTPPTLNGSASINSLTFLTGNEMLAGSGTVTLAATGTAGITDSAGVSGDTETVAPSVVLGSSQTWTATANSTLKVTGNVSGAQSLAVTGAGTVKLGGANTFQGLTVGTGSDAPTVLFTNTSGSASGTTTLTVNGGATIGGNGTSSGTTFNIAGTGTATGTRANVLVGLTLASAINTTGTLSLIASSTATITNANLTFNINSQVAGQGTELNVGSTLLTFGSGVQSTTLTLNVENTGVINGSPLYVLIAGSTSGGTDQYSGLDLGTGVGNIATGLLTPILNSGVGGSGNVTLALTGLSNTWYGAHSELFLYQNSGTGADDIEVEVVPEPGTWALMLGGLAVLVFWQRRKGRA